MDNELNLINLMLEAGVIVQLVVVLLILASVFSWAIFLMKKKQYSLLEKENKIFLQSFYKLKSFQDSPLIITKNSSSPLCHILELCFEEYSKIVEARGEEGAKLQLESFGLSSISRSIDHGIIQSDHTLKKSLNHLASIGSISPFVGLFGTVVGIINSFQGLSQGGGSLEAVAPGIAEALVATAIGLAAAIPAVWFFNLFNARVASLNKDTEKFSQDLLNLVERSL